MPERCARSNKIAAASGGAYETFAKLALGVSGDDQCAGFSQ
jgi:hypothetical protein